MHHVCSIKAFSASAILALFFLLTSCFSQEQINGIVRMEHDRFRGTSAAVVRMIMFGATSHETGGVEVIARGRVGAPFIGLAFIARGSVIRPRMRCTVEAMVNGRPFELPRPEYETEGSRVNLELISERFILVLDRDLAQALLTHRPRFRICDLELETTPANDAALQRFWAMYSGRETSPVVAPSAR